MRKLTIGEFDAWLQAVSELEDFAGRAPALLQGAARVLDHNAVLGNLDGAIAVGAAAIAGAVDGWRPVFDKFERATLRALGERRRDAEGEAEFVARITDLDVSAMILTAHRNGIQW